MASNTSKEEKLPDPHDLEGAVVWLKDKGLLFKSRKCVSCNEQLKLMQSFTTNTSEIWDCLNTECKKRSIAIMSTDGSFFPTVSEILTLARWIHLIKHWCEKIEVSEVCNLLHLKGGVVNKAFKICREFCTYYFQRNSVKLGGEKSVVIVRTYKSNLKLILVMVEKGKNIGYMKLINDEDSSTKLSIVENVLNPGSVIASDEWGSPPEGVSNFQIRNCTDEENKICEAYQIDARYTILLATHNMVVKPENYLNEYMWRERYQDNAFVNFIQHLKDYYNPEG